MQIYLTTAGIGLTDCIRRMGGGNVFTGDCLSDCPKKGGGGIPASGSRFLLQPLVPGFSWGGGAWYPSLWSHVLFGEVTPTSLRRSFLGGVREVTPTSLPRSLGGGGGYLSQGLTPPPQPGGLKHTPPPPQPGQTKNRLRCGRYVSCIFMNRTVFSLVEFA